MADALAEAAKQIAALQKQVRKLQARNTPSVYMGWTNIPVLPTYVSATSMLFTGIDLTAHLTGYVKCRWYQGGWRYGYVASSSLGSGNTTAVILGNAVLYAAITDFSISYGNPVDFPGALSWAAVPTGVTIGNGTTLAKFSIESKKLFFDFVFTLGNTSAVSGEFSFNLPLTVSSSGVSTVTGSFRDTGTAYHATITSLSSTRCYLYRVIVSGDDVTGGVQDATTPFTWTTNDQIGATGWCMLP